MREFRQGWISVADRLPEDGSPVLMVEPAAAWGDEMNLVGHCNYYEKEKG